MNQLGGIDVEMSTSVSQANAEPKATVIAFVNYNSGGKMGKELASALAEELGPEFVFNLALGGPLPGLNKYNGTPNLRIAVCGGDGTVNWVLSSIRQTKMSPEPAIGIIPMGTGNDAARAFGWGCKFYDMATAVQAVEDMRTCPIAPWDRWHIEMNHKTILTTAQEKNMPAFVQKMTQPFQFDPRSNTKTNSTENKESKDDGTANVGVAVDTGDKAVKTNCYQAEFNNYLSFGVDAQIMTDFHEHRESHRDCYPCRCCNMTWMGLWGFLNCCMCQAETMNIKIERPVSGSELVGDNDNSDDREWEEVFIPPGIKGVVFLNLLTYAGGRNIWGTSQSVGNEIDKGQSSLADGMIELVGIDSSFHLSQMVLEVSRGVRLARMNECKITCSDIHIQLDGEPWEEHPVTYHIRPLPQARMLHRPDYTEPCC